MLWYFLGFPVRHEGIDLDPTKAEAINIWSPHNVQTVEKLYERVSYVRRFIQALAEPLESFHKLLKENVLKMGLGATNNISESQRCASFISNHDFTGERFSSNFVFYLNCQAY